MKRDTTVARGERKESAQREDRSEGKGREDVVDVDLQHLDDMLRNEALENALPKPPAISGWHTCWLSTTNQYVPIQYFVRLGYVPVTPEEVKGWDYMKQHSAKIGEHVTVNEMILYKVPEQAYQQIMRTVHHDRPNEESERLKANIDLMKAGSEYRDSSGASLVREEGDGMASVLDRRVKPGRFE